MARQRVLGGEGRSASLCCLPEEDMQILSVCEERETERDRERERETPGCFYLFTVSRHDAFPAQFKDVKRLRYIH